MNFLYEILPVLLFFIAFKVYGIYVATVVGIVATFVQVVLTKYLKKKWDKMQLVTLSAFTIFGGLTLYLHDPIFIKWKPTIVFWIFALVILGSQVITKKTVIQRLFENAIAGAHVIPHSVWKKLNLAWGVFFATLGGINLYIAYHLSNDAWVNFKFYGITGALLLLSIVQAFYLMRYLEAK